MVHGTVHGYEYLIDPANLEASKTACQWLMILILTILGVCMLMVIYLFCSKRVVFTINNFCFVLGVVIILSFSYTIRDWQEESKLDLLDDFSRSCVDLQFNEDFINLSSKDLME